MSDDGWFPTTYLRYNAIDELEQAWQKLDRDSTKKPYGFKALVEWRVIPVIGEEKCPPA